LLVSLWLCSESTFAEKPIDADDYVEIGNEAFDIGEIDAAIAAYSKAIELDPGHAGAHNNRGLALREKGEYAKALDDYVKMLPIVPVMSIVSGTGADPRRKPEQPFLFAVNDVFTINGIGTVASGQVVRGAVKTGEEIEIVGSGETLKSTVTRINLNGRSAESAPVDAKCDLVLRGVGKDEVQRGEVLVLPGSIAPRKTFEAEVYLLTKAEGGRSTPIAKNYRPHFFFRTSDVTGTVTDLGGREAAAPGDRFKITVELTETAALEPGLLFAIREGGRTVGMGVASKL
jgi:elongation factor Tu